MDFWNIRGGINTVLVLIVTVFILLYLYVDWKYRYWQRRGVKSPTLFEVLRSLRKGLKQPIHEATVSSYEKYGRLFGLSGFFPQLWVSEPDLVKKILVKDFNVFRNRMRFNFGEGLFQKMLSVLCDEDWKRVRCIMSPTFSSSKMRKMAILVKECSANASKFFQELAEKDEEFDIKPHFGSFAVDVIATTAFATKVNSLHDPDNEFLVNARKLSNRDVSLLKTFIVVLFPRLSKWLNLELIPTEPIKYYRGLVMKIVEEREKTKMKGHDFLQLMMDAREGVNENANEEATEERQIENLPKHKTMSMEEVICQCLLFFTAGHDTTATTMSFVGYHLALNPDCQEKLVNEIQSTWEKHGDFGFDIVSKMSYLEAVLCETLRINSTATLLMRLSSEDYPLGDTGIVIPKESTIMIPIYAMHRDPEWFPDPDKFNPDRFLPENKHLIKPFTYLPFGDGPRNCIGMRFVVMVMKLCLCYILKEVKFVATEETRKPLEFYYGQGIGQTKRIPMKLEKR